MSVYRGALFLLILLSECVLKLGFKLYKKDAVYIWSVLSPYFAEAKEIYDAHYQKDLN